MAAQVVFEIDLEILGELSPESVLRAVRLFIDNQVGCSSGFDPVETAFGYFSRTITLTKLNPRDIVAISVTAEIHLSLSAVGIYSMINLPSMICLLMCRGKFQADRNAVLISDHWRQYTHRNMSIKEGATLPPHTEARDIEIM